MSAENSSHTTPLSNSRIPSDENPTTSTFEEMNEDNQGGRNRLNGTSNANSNENNESSNNPGSKSKDADNFLVCVFNVSSKVSYR